MTMKYGGPFMGLGDKDKPSKELYEWIEIITEKMKEQQDAQQDAQQQPSDQDKFLIEWLLQQQKQQQMQAQVAMDVEQQQREDRNILHNAQQQLLLQMVAQANETRRQDQQMFFSLIDRLFARIGGCGGKADIESIIEEKDEIIQCQVGIIQRQANQIKEQIKHVVNQNATFLTEIERLEIKLEDFADHCRELNDKNDRLKND